MIHIFSILLILLIISRSKIILIQMVYDQNYNQNETSYFSFWKNLFFFSDKRI